MLTREISFCLLRPNVHSSNFWCQSRMMEWLIFSPKVSRCLANPWAGDGPHLTMQGFLHPSTISTSHICQEAPSVSNFAAENSTSWKWYLASIKASFLLGGGLRVHRKATNWKQVKSNDWEGGGDWERDELSLQRNDPLNLFTTTREVWWAPCFSLKMAV